MIKQVLSVAIYTRFSTIGLIIGLCGGEETLMGSLINLASSIIQVPIVFGLSYSFIKLKRNEEVKAFDFLKENDLSSMEDGTYPIEGDHIYAMLQSFDVKQPIDVEFETHRRYLDIQYVLEGTLKIRIADRKDLSPVTEYDPSADVIFYERTYEDSTISLTPGVYAIFFPNDAHRMVCFPEEGDCPKIRKCVVKVEVVQ